MLLLLTTAPAFADTPPDDAAWGNRQAGSSSGSSNNSSSSSSSDDDDAGFGKKRKWLGWWWQPYVEPGGGVQIDTSNGNVSATVGATVGTQYWKKKWLGDLHLGGSYTLGTDENSLSGYAIELGNDFGRREKYWGAQIGVTGIYSGYSSSSGDTVLDPSVGVAIPLELTVGPKKYYGFGGIAPAWYLDPGRREYGDNPKPFLGDELTWYVGAGLKVSWATAELAWTQTTTSAGSYGTPTIELTVNP